MLCLKIYPKRLLNVKLELLSDTRFSLVLFFILWQNSDELNSESKFWHNYRYCFLLVYYQLPGVWKLLGC